jgi:hypothetical protein
MQKVIVNIITVLAIFSFGYLESKGQIINSNLSEESIGLFTDRTLYISGEQIQFAAYPYYNRNLSNESKSLVNPVEQSKNIENPDYILSNVVYIELITPEGEKIAKGKFLCEKSYSSGFITIPKDVASGNYYIRAYTKFMRNNGPSSYSYINLKIVNPFKSDILTYNHINTPAPKDSVKSENTLSEQKLISIVLNKNEYTTREQVKVQINGLNLLTNTIRGLNFTVIPDSSIVEENMVFPIAEKPLINNYYYPETNGLSVTGRLKDNKTENSLPNTIVNLSILGGCKDFMAALTDSSGRFFFRLPSFTGSNDIFLCTETLVDTKTNIFIDNDFCTSGVKLSTPPFHLTEMEKKVAYNMALNVQIASQFNREIPKDSSRYANKAFYGEPQEKLYLDNYIQLPTIEDYINEIIPILKIRKHQGEKYFKIFSTQVEMDIYKPLVLLDLVAIDNPKKILSLSPQSISHIDVIDFPYVKGSITYGGIISFFSRKGDFAGVDLPNSGVFLDFNFLKDGSKNYSSDTLRRHQPDYRNTLIWEPNITLDSEKSKDLYFKTSDTPGKYIVILRGITSQGKVFTCKKSFIVRD